MKISIQKIIFLFIIMIIPNYCFAEYVEQSNNNNRPTIAGTNSNSNCREVTVNHGDKRVICDQSLQHNKPREIVKYIPINSGANHSVTSQSYNSRNYSAVYTRPRPIGFTERYTIINQQPVIEKTIYVQEGHPVEYVETTEIVKDTNSTETLEHQKLNLGFGLRFLGSYISPYKLHGTDLKEEHNIGVGIGWYIKYRPIRWFSVELLNDYILTTNNYADQFTRIPVYIDFQAHLFDYGALDLYAVIGVGCAWKSLDGNVKYNNNYVQWGGQFGIGASLTFSIIELGLDIRYTIESRPCGYVDYDKNSLIIYDNDQSIHGVNFVFYTGLSF